MAQSAPPATPYPSGITVIIPAYNYAHYLPQAIDSVLDQKHPCCEILIVDDGSTDNTAAVVAAYGKRVRYLHQTNAGLPAARNTGIRHASHGQVCFLDADDLLLPGHLCAAQETLAALPENFVLVAFPAQYLDAAGTPLALKQIASTGHEISERDIILKTRFQPSGVVVRRDVFAIAGEFDETLRSAEDRDMWLRIAACGKIHLHAKRLVGIRRHPVSMSRNSDRMKANTRRVIVKAWHARRVAHSEIGFWLRVHSFRLYQAAWMYHEEVRRAAAIRDLIFSLILWPWFSQPSELNEPPLFRLRSLRRFLLRR